jgi:hypothetical protein
MEAKEALDVIREGLSPLEIRAYDHIRKLLWVIYPRPDSLDINPEDDVGSADSALMIIDDLKRHGLTVSELDDPYESPSKMSQQEVDDLMEKYRFVQ